MARFRARLFFDVDDARNKEKEKAIVSSSLAAGKEEERRIFRADESRLWPKWQQAQWIAFAPPAPVKKEA